MDKEHVNKGKPDIKGIDNSLKEEINVKRNPLIIILGALLSVVILLNVFTSAWFYKTISMQEDKVDALTQKLEQMPKPISQGRLGLMINKSNQNLEAKMRDDVIALQEKILEIRKEIESNPQPISEGKVGLIVEKAISRLRIDLERQFEKNLVSSRQNSQIKDMNRDIVEKMQKQVVEIEESLIKIEEIIGSYVLSKPITDEIIDLKNSINFEKKTGDSLPFYKELEITDFRKKDFASISRKFSDYAHKAIKEDLRTNVKDGFINSLINKFQRVFVKRSLTPQEGDSVDAILSRAESALNLKDYKKVIDELNQLPIGASVIMDQWRKKFDIFLETQDRD